MKITKNQELKSSSMLLLFGLVIGCGAIIATPWNRTMNEDRSERALHRAEIVGYQIVQLYRESNKDVNPASTHSRGPASVAPETVDLRKVGTMGSDPWGQAFHYRILSTEQSKLRILVWSLGPNQIGETVALDDEDAKIEAQPHFSGDDMGVVMNIPIN